MYKKCVVVEDNECVTVVECDGQKIQFPHRDFKSNELYVGVKDGNYTLLDEKPKIKSVPKVKVNKDENETTRVIKADEPEKMVVL